MSFGSMGAGVALLASVAAAAAYGLLTALGRRGPASYCARVIALLALASAAALGGEGWLLALALALFCLADGLVRQGTSPQRPGFLACGQALALLALAAEAALALRAGGGAALLKAQPLRLAGLLAAVSLAVLAARRGPLRFTKDGPQGLVILGAVFVVSAVSLTLPLHRGCAMGGGLFMLFALTPLGAPERRSAASAKGDARGRRRRAQAGPSAGGLGLASTSLFYVGQALFAAAFIPALGRLQGP